MVQVEVVEPDEENADGEEELKRRRAVAPRRSQKPYRSSFGAGSRVLDGRGFRGLLS
jgi:hypothetical protein